MGWVYSTSEVGLYKAPGNSGQPVRRCPSICIHLCTFCSNICVLPRFKLAWPWSESPRSFKRDQGAHPRGASRGLCSLLGGVSSGSKSNFSSSSDPRGMNSNKATSLAEEAAQTSCLRGGQARAWSDPAALVVVAQTEPSTQARGGCQHAGSRSLQQLLWPPRMYRWVVTRLGSGSDQRHLPKEPQTQKGECNCHISTKGDRCAHRHPLRKAEKHSR